MVNEMMLQLVEEMVNPEEIVLDEQIEEAVELEEDTIAGTDDLDDEIICRIDNGDRVGYEDPIDFTDDDVEDAAADDLLD